MQIDPKKLQMVDAWNWAYHNKIKLVAGHFTLEGHEYQVEMMQSKAKRQCAKKATQMAFTETFVLRTLHKLRYGYYPLGCLYLFPTGDDVADFSSTRFKPLIKDNPRTIGQYVRDTDRTNLKRIVDSYLYFRGAKLTQEIQGKKTSSKLKSIPVDGFVVDERDEMEDQAITMAKGRYKHSHIQEEAYLGNPTIPHYGIDEIYEQSDQRVWMIPCRKCGKETCLELEFPGCLHRTKDDRVIRLCIHCRDQVLYPREGHWVPLYPERSKDMEGRWISHLNSIFVDPKEILDTYENPNLTKTDKQEFYNLTLGMAWLDAESQLIENDIYNICGRDPFTMIHPGPTAMGVDIGSKLHVVVGYRPNETQLGILYVARVSSWNDVHDIAKRMNVSCAVIDSEPELHKAREFQEEEPYEIFLCDYYERQRKSPSFNQDDGMVKINRTEICDATHDLIKKEGKCRLPRKNEELRQFAKEMCNIVKTLHIDEKTNSREFRYKPLGSGRPDHYRHATNYFLLASMRIPVYEEKAYRFRPSDAWDDGFEEDQEGSSFLRL